MIESLDEDEIPLPPAVPADVSALAKSDSEIQISWTASDDAASYRVYRSDAADGDYDSINSATAAETAYDDGGLEANTTYFYKVTAVKDDLESEQSESVSATTFEEAAPAIGINYTATANGEADKTTSNAIRLIFEEPVPGLATSDITVSAGTANATKGALTAVDGSDDTEYDLEIGGVTIEGTVYLKITKDGVNDADRIVDVHSVPITYNVANIGGTAFVRDSTAIRLTFNKAVADLSPDDILLSAGTPAAVSNYATASAEKGSLTQVSGTVYELALANVTRTGTLGVRIEKTGIETVQKNVIVNAKVDKTALQPMPPRDYFPRNIYDLPKSTGLNDLFKFLNPDAGTDGRVENEADWSERRGELRDLIQYYYYGRKYPTPKSAITINAQTNQINVTINDNGRNATGSLGSVTVPSGTAPAGGWPVIIAFGFGQTAMATQNGYAVISVSNWGGSRTGNYYNLYPFNPYEYDFNTGSIMTAAWTVSRIIDAMEISAEANGGTNQWNINPRKSITTGVSINGKYALMSAAMDDRVGAAAPVDSGQSGVSSFRYIAEGKLFYYNSPLDRIYRRNQKGLNSIQYSGESFWMGLGTAAGFHLQTDMDYLPFDSHAVEALMAPRPLIAFAADNNFDWTTPPASVTAISAAKEVYEFLGSDNIAVRVRDGAHAIQDRDVPFMIAVMDKEFGGKSLEVRDLYPSSNPPSYGIGTYDNISDMTIYPYDFDSSYIQWSRPGKYTLWAENEIVTEGVPATIKVHSDDTKVKLTILDADNKPTEASWTADVAGGIAVFDLTEQQVKVGRYEITTVGTAKDRKTIYFQGVDLATALRHGTARNDNGAAVMYGFTSKINKGLVEVYADGSRLTQSFQEDTEQAWILNYGVTTNPNENNNIPNSAFNIITLKKLQMEAMPGSTFEISIDKSKLASSQETVSWNASAAVQKIGPQPNWPPYPNSLTDDGSRPLLPETTTNFKAAVAFSLNEKADLAAGGTLKVTSSEPMYKGDFGIGFDFSDDFALRWADDGKSVEVTFNNVTKARGDVCNVYIMRLSDAAGNLIAAPIRHSFILEPSSDVLYNEGFESGNTLQQNGDVTFARTQEYAAAGSSSLKVAPTAANNYSGVALRNSSLTTPMLPGGKYKLTAKALSAKNATLGVRVETKDSAGADTYGSVGKATVTLTAGQWADVAMEFTVPADHQSVSAIVFHNDAQIPDFTFYLDEVKLQLLSSPEPGEEPEIRELLRFDFDDEAEQGNLFTSAASSKLEWMNETGAGRSDDTALKITHINGTSYTSADNAVRLTLDEPLPAGGVYNISAWFYAPAAGNEGKGVLTGPGVVLNQDYANSAYKLPSSPGTLPIGEWKEVNVQTPLMERPLQSIDFRLVVNDAANHADVWRIDHIVISQVGDLKEIPKWDLTLPSIADTYKNDFLIGNVMSPAQTTDAENTAMYKHHYSIMTPENDMKPQYLSSANGVYSYANADTLVDWAQANNIKVHGHTLVWHSQSAPWLTTGTDNGPLTRAEAKANMEQYIGNVAGHFKGKVVSWDVVNEAFDGGSGLPADWKIVLRKDSPWYKAYANGADESRGESGADYIYDAFVLARLADPGATLYYNDYNETVAWKREAMALMAEELNEKWKTDERNAEPGRLLVEGIGMQAHYWIESLDPDTVEASIARFIQAGVKVSVTELDIPSTGTLTEEKMALQAELYAKLFVIYKKYASSIERVTFWGKADSQSWRASGSPLLFDKLLAAKPAFYAVIDPEGYLHLSPAAPTAVSAQAKSSSEIEVSWTASDRANGYNVYRSSSVDGSYSKINTQLVTETKFRSGGLSASTTYYYKVAAVNEAGESVLSAAAHATTGSRGTTSPGNPSPSAPSGPSPAEQTPAKPGEVNAEVDSGGNAKASVTADDMKKALPEAEAGTLKLQVQGVENANRVTVSIPVDQVNAAEEAGIKRIEIFAGLASVQLPVSLFEGAAGGVVELTITKVDNSTLSPEARARVGSNAVYDFSLSVDGRQLADFGQGQTVRVAIPYELKPGENPNQIVIYYLSDDGKPEVIKNGRYNKDTGMAEFSAKHFSQYAAVANPVTFRDTKAIAWASDSIDGLAARGIVNGMTKDSFAPANSVTRAEFIHMLMLTLDLSQANATSTFSDVKEGAWYYSSVAAAQRLGIVNGLTDGSFGVGDKITRQEMALMAYRAIREAGIALNEEKAASALHDAQDIASYAKDAVSAMHQAGIINGVGGDRFDPKGTATRAQAAVILYQLLMKSL
ncbi:endo-1,4-beta-xylanase [Cohnella cellulosilytica]|uniref:Beta-xylanase n=2 Tax=Cohnella cellulosilytica TaxID=986710 RepID=A0ABW2FJ21_9BACL